MIANQQALAQVFRLSRLMNYPREDTPQDHAALDELVAAVRMCDDAQHAQAAVTRIIRSSKFCPTPAELYEAIDAERRDPSFTHDLRGCAECKGTGWRLVYALATWDGRRASTERITEEQYHELRHKVQGVGIQAVYTAAEHCHCPKGAAMNAARPAA